MHGGKLKQFDYFGALRYRYKATKLKTVFGIHAAISGCRLPLVENTVEKRSNIIKLTAMPIPTARCTPVPPRVLRLATYRPDYGEQQHRKCY
jgi:hypothetical protein